MSATEPRPKLIYFAERHPDFDPDGFTRRWRQHARLGMSMARWVNIDRYVHCDPLDLALPPGVARRACDGVALLWYRSEIARRRHVSDQEARAIMKRDEVETFARPVAGFSFMAEEVVHRPASEAMATLFLLMTCRTDMTAGQFAAYRRDVLGPRIAASVPAAAYTQNFPAVPPIPGGLAVDGIDEISIGDPNALDLRALGGALDGLEVAEVAGLWTRQVELYRADAAA